MLAAEYRPADRLTLSFTQVAEVFAGQRFAFSTKAGAALDLDLVLVGIEGELPTNDASNDFTRWRDDELVVDLTVEVPL